MPQKDRKGAPKASATMKSSKAGFDTYDADSAGNNDSVTVAKRGSSYGNMAKKDYNDTLKSLSKLDEPESSKKYVANSSAGISVKSRAKLETGKGVQFGQSIKEMKEHFNRKYPADKDHKFFKHTQKDNK